jgi:hypothetical protein
MKVETDTIASITESPVGRGAILEIMYVETFKTDIAFIRNIIMCLRSHWLIILSISQFFNLLFLRVPDEGYFEGTWWRLFQKRFVPTKFDIYVFDFRVNLITKVKK